MKVTIIELINFGCRVRTPRAPMHSKGQIIEFNRG